MRQFPRLGKTRADTPLRGEQENSFLQRHIMSQYSQGLLDAALDLIKRGTQGLPFTSRADLARAAEVSEANLSRWLSGASTPTLKKLEPVLAALGAKLVLPDENGTYTTVPDIRLSLPEKGQLFADGRIPVENDFILVPLVGDVGCGSTLPSLHKDPELWIPLPRTLVGPEMWVVRVCKGDRSMLPRVHPGDFAVVDRRRIGDTKPENIYLVQQPTSEGAGISLRRARETTVHGKSMIMFYADNTAEGYQPQIFDLGLYPGSSLREAIKGRVVMLLSNIGVR